MLNIFGTPIFHANTRVHIMIIYVFLEIHTKFFDKASILLLL